MHRETLWHYESKERLGNVCVLRHEVYHLESRLLIKLFYWILI
jgi:hypothetical protein